MSNAKEVCDGVREILLRKKDEKCDETTVTKKIVEFEQTLGLLDAAFSYLSIPGPTDDEKKGKRGFTSIIEEMEGSRSEHQFKSTCDGVTYL
jgi:hypothetical protein